MTDTYPQRCKTLDSILTEIEDGISVYEKEHEHNQVYDDCLGLYIPTNVVRRLIAVRKHRNCTSHISPQPDIEPSEGTNIL